MLNPTPPNGHFIQDMIVFHGLDEGKHIAKGFIFEPPELDNAPVSQLNSFQDQISLLLASLADGQRLQVQYYCNSDYRSELMRYQAETERMTNPWTRRCRNERFVRYWTAMEARELRRQQLILYISRRIDQSAGKFDSTRMRCRHYQALLDQFQIEFGLTQQLLADIFSGQGARIIPMTNADYHRHYQTFLNPSLADRPECDLMAGYDPYRSIQENCWHAEAAGQADHGFWMDGAYHTILVLTRWPKVTYPGIIRRLTALRLLDYTITVNVDPLPVHQEVVREEKEYERLAGDYASEHKESLRAPMEKKLKKIAALTHGDTLPFNVNFIIRVWDKSRDGLAVKTSAIKNAINGMNGAQYFESALPSATRKIFFESWPGWTWGPYEYRKLYGENRYVADMLPFSATFTGYLDKAEAIYEGPARNLIGIKTFSGEGADISPQHAVLLGMSGTGKSVTVCDLLAQTEGYFAYTVIIEEGLSYGIYTRTVDPTAQPIIIQPDGNLTINYLDTKGLPLSAEHLSSAMALVARMAGTSQHEDKQLLRQAEISKYILLLYEDIFEDWSRHHADQLPAIARHAFALKQYRREKMPPGSTSLEAFAGLRDWRAASPDEAQAYIGQFDEADVLKFLKDPATSREVRNLAYAYFKAEEYPTHRMLQELMALQAAGPQRTEVMEIATLLAPWCRDGNYGALFDGTTNVSLNGRIAHFELGYIPDSARELRAAAGFLITNDARKQILNLPRALRKRNVYEEVARFLDIPGGEEIVKESYAQLRKFNCWNIAIVQQYARFKQSRIRSAVFGNSRQFFLMRQNDRADLDDISRDIAIPEVTKHGIMNYPLPDHQSGQKYSAFTYMHLDSNRPVCGTVHNIASPEMLYCSSSSGGLFEKRAKELASAPTLFEGIIQFANQPKETKTT